MQLHSYLQVHVIQAHSTLCTTFLPLKKVAVCFLVFYQTSSLKNTHMDSKDHLVDYLLLVGTR